MAARAAVAHIQAPGIAVVPATMSVNVVKHRSDFTDLV